MKNLPLHGQKKTVLPGLAQQCGKNQQHYVLIIGWPVAARNATEVSHMPSTNAMAILILHFCSKWLMWFRCTVTTAKGEDQITVKLQLIQCTCQYEISHSLCGNMKLHTLLRQILLFEWHYELLHIAQINTSVHVAG